MTSEVLIVVTNESRPNDHGQDGDIVTVKSDRMIAQTHQQHLCVDLSLFNSYGLRVPDSPMDVYLRTVSQYRFDRVSRHEVLRVPLGPGARAQQAQKFGPVLQGDEQIDAELYVRRRVRNPNHKIFGTPGEEYWYGGRTDMSPEVVASVWNAIEPLLGVDRSNYTTWPWSPQECRSFLALRYPGTDDVRVARMMGGEIDYDQFQPEYDPKGKRGPIAGDQVVRKRRFGLPQWRDLPGVNVADALNKTKEYDGRSIQGNDYADLLAKPRVNIWSERGHLDPSKGPMVP